MTDTGVMSDAETTHVSTTDSHDDHGSGHGSAAAGEPLGPVDVTAWAYTVAGGAIGVVVVLALFVARAG